MYDDAYTRNEDGELAVRTVNVNEGSNSSSYDDVFTRDEDGKLALRVTGNGGGGGGDQHNLGYYATQSALEEAHPTAEAGDWAIVGSTDTVWIWDTDNSEWVDSDTKGQVTSVNGQTGDVVIPTAPTYTAGVGIDIANDEISLADTGEMPAQDEPFMLTATEDSGTGEVTTSWTDNYVRSINGNYGDVYLDASSLGAVPQWNHNTPNNPLSFPQSYEGCIIQYNGETDPDFTNGYFYKSVIDTSVPESATLGTVAEVGISNVALDASTFIDAIGSSDSDTSYTFDWNDTD